MSWLTRLGVTTAAIAAVGLAIGSGACASNQAEIQQTIEGGTDGKAPPGGDSGTAVDSGPVFTTDTGTAADTRVEDVVSDGACGASQTVCDAGCADLSNDPMNCGACGHACSANQGCANSTCGTLCTPPEVLCGAGGGEAGAEGGAAEAGGATYCANLTNDPANCGACGKVCGNNHICSTGNCTLNCPSNTTACTSGDVCISMGECCTKADCTVTNADCPTPGGQCACAMGTTLCTANNTCIPSNTCCSSADCTIVGEQCSGPGGTCACPGGFQACPASNSCIPMAACCTSNDCTVTGETCSGPGGQCSCQPSYKLCPQGNECIPQNTCCTNADCNVAGQTCPGFGGTCGCPLGDKICPASNTCIPIGSCCDNTDCTVGGETCSGIGGTCGCPGGEVVCTANNACIGATACCTNASCSAGETCPMPGGNCSCAVGDTFCPALPGCIPSTNCCTSLNCPNTSEVAATACTPAGGTCSIAACDAGYYDVDKQYADGCECHDDGVSQSCNAATNEGVLSIGGGASVTGNLPFAGDANFISVGFSGNTQLTYHPNILFTNNPNNEYLFDITEGCGGPAPPCGSEGGTCTGKVQWDVSYSASITAHDTTAATFAPIPALPTLVVRVYRNPASPTITCDSYTIQISN
jgi:hypothetical protein